MVAVYAIATVLGVIAIVTWVILGSVAESVAGKESLDPEDRLGPRGRAVVAGIAGFGLGGMSASYSGAATPWALAGALLGAVAMIVLGRYLGVEKDADGESA